MIRLIKIGGNVVDNEELLLDFTAMLAKLEGDVVIVHGGGVMASRMQKAMGMEPLMIAGRRVTDEETLKVVTMVYAGWCNKHITAALQGCGRNSIGLTGADGNAIKATRRAPLTVEGREVDYGFVGDVKPEGVNASFLKTLLSEGVTPVLCAINHDGNGNLLNTNADTIASSVAVSLAEAGEEVELIFCFEKPGVLYDKDDDSSVIPVINPELFLSLKAEGRVADGMLPKLENAFKAIGRGVKQVVIKHAKDILNDNGTVLKNE
ncbi:MAG: acetylglutamate kinase [Bacteroidales bacterium]|nr:acetylglutamate kinase [Bacteroidales bacterium]